MYKLTVAKAHDLYWLFPEAERLLLPNDGASLIDMFDFCQRNLSKLEMPMQQYVSRFFRVPLVANRSVDVLAVHAFVETIALRAHLAGEIKIPSWKLAKHIDEGGRLRVWDEIAARLIK